MRTSQLLAYDPVGDIKKCLAGKPPELLEQTLKGFFTTILLERDNHFAPYTLFNGSLTSECTFSAAVKNTLGNDKISMESKVVFLTIYVQDPQNINKKMYKAIEAVAERLLNSLRENKNLKSSSAESESENDKHAADTGSAKPKTSAPESQQPAAELEGNAEQEPPKVVASRKVLGRK